jgi:hypothetical protein
LEELLNCIFITITAAGSALDGQDTADTVLGACISLVHVLSLHFIRSHTAYSVAFLLSVLNLYVFPHVSCSLHECRGVRTKLRHGRLVTAASRGWMRELWLRQGMELGVKIYVKAMLF